MISVLLQLGSLWPSMSNRLSYTETEWKRPIVKKKKKKKCSIIEFHLQNLVSSPSFLVLPVVKWRLKNINMSLTHTNMFWWRDLGAVDLYWQSPTPTSTWMDYQAAGPVAEHFFPYLPYCMNCRVPKIACF